MILEKIKEKGIDISITLVDEFKYLYKAEPYKAHSNYNSFKLCFSFETYILDDEEHTDICAYYKNANGVYLIKIQDESFDNLLNKIKDWNVNHKIGE